MKTWHHYTSDKAVPISRWSWPRSLYGRLMLVPAVLLAVGLLGTISAVLLHAKSRGAAEVSSGLLLGHDVARAALRNLAEAASPEAALTALANELPRVRHVRFAVEPDTPSPGTNQLTDTSTRSGPLLAMSSLLPPPVAEHFPIVVRGRTIGTLILRSDPADEVAEIIEELELFAVVIAGLCALILLGLLVTVRLSLRPLQTLLQGFNRLEHGDYRPVPAIRVAELEPLGRQFNRLPESLDTVTADNRLLIDRLFLIKDSERKELAAELHDDIGPVLFAIRAETACLMKTLAGDSQALPRAKSIAELTDSLQRVNYRMLERLRPLILEQMGLLPAVRQLVASWQARYPHVAWSLETDAAFEDPAEVVGLTLYRATQEGITNAVRHAQASKIAVKLERDPAGGILPAVRDNGRGLPRFFHYGFGLLGMMDRVGQLGGSLVVRDTHPGVAIEVSLPAPAEQATENAYAYPAD